MNQINIDELIGIIGAKEIELYVLKKKVAALQEELKNLSEKERTRD